jgi:thiamine phosphate synthase YjbQ (UPF0047 family)
MSASLLIQEKCGAGRARDLEAYFVRIAREDQVRYDHDDEGCDDMSAHLSAAITQ